MAYDAAVRAFLARSRRRMRQLLSPPATPRAETPAADHLAFQCNICGAYTLAPVKNLARETPSCTHCGSTVRMRALMCALTVEVLGEAKPLPELRRRPEIIGAGMSDWIEYAGRLAEAFSYTNYFYDREPRLDITRPPGHLRGKLDFLISTDVFEHVAPPVADALANARRLLKPSGVLIFSVPYMSHGDNIEHFPNLYDYSLEGEGGTRHLVNRTRHGTTEVFDDLVFHGGEGLTLEMRVFSEPGLRRELDEAGFETPRLYAESDDRFGIRWDPPLSVPMALRPRREQA